MPKYYSPRGDCEDWLSKPEGYFTKEEWTEMHPVVLQEEIITTDESELTLEEHKSNKLDELCRIRLTKEYGGFVLDDAHWDSKPKSERRLLSLLTVMCLIDKYEFSGWEIEDGIHIDLTHDTAAKALVAMFNHYAKCVAKEAELIEEINALNTIEEVQNYVINFDV